MSLLYTHTLDSSGIAWKKSPASTTQKQDYSTAFLHCVAKSASSGTFLTLLKCLQGTWEEQRGPVFSDTLSACHVSKTGGITPALALLHWIIARAAGFEWLFRKARGGRKEVNWVHSPTQILVQETNPDLLNSAVLRLQPGRDFLSGVHEDNWSLYKTSLSYLVDISLHISFWHSSTNCWIENQSMKKTLQLIHGIQRGKQSFGYTRGRG
jgi:hypothetical protein